MKLLSINPASATVGGVLTVLTLFSAGAVQVPAFLRVGVTNALEVQGIPRPQDMVQIREGEAFLVPPDMLFVLTGLGVTGAGGTADAHATLTVDGVEVAAARAFLAGSSIHAVPPGLTVGGGKTVEVPASFGDGRAWGYLVDA